MEPRPRLAQLPPTRPRPVIVPALLQPPTPAQRRRRPTTHHPRPPSAQAGHLGDRGARGLQRGDALERRLLGRARAEDVAGADAPRMALQRGPELVLRLAALGVDDRL